MSKHTPGPWEFDPMRSAVFQAKKDRFVFYVRVALGDSKFSAEKLQKENVANLNLIAAAPDMLDALEKCVLAVLEDHYEGNARIGKRADITIKNALKIIAKAKGEDVE
ncbi:MAG: hypothetical protein OEZ55_12375 [Nitrospinota bacterium]|nr:hypothetical protein [Nitrospinota bacterium]